VRRTRITPEGQGPRELCTCARLRGVSEGAVGSEAGLVGRYSPGGDWQSVTIVCAAQGVNQEAESATCGEQSPSPAVVFVP
jgi:hypothetical protein